MKENRKERRSRRGIIKVSPKCKLRNETQAGISNRVQYNGYQKMFRYSDETITMGKYSGKKIKDIPASYIQWMIKECNLSPNDKSILETLYKNNFTVLEK